MWCSGSPGSLLRSRAHEYYEDDVNKLTDLARLESGISTLHEATAVIPRAARRISWCHAGGCETVEPPSHGELFS